MIGCKIYFVAYQNKRFNFAPLASKNWKTTNLELLKFEARFAYAVKFLTDFFDLKPKQIHPYEILNTNVCYI